jgi:flagellar basal body-associated protein FliL
MDELKLFLAAYWQLITAFVSFMLFVLALKVWWSEVKFFMMRTGWSLPLVGRLARAGRSDHKLGGDGWYPVEKRVCSDFYEHYKDFSQSPDYYEKCDDYLNKVEESGRSEKGPFLWALIIGLILLEAVGFAYVLAPFMAKNASSNEQTMLAWFVAFLLSIAAVFLTELTGKEWHKNSLLKKIRGWWDIEGKQKKLNLMPEKDISIDKTYNDNNSMKFQQVLNRVPANASVTPNYTATIITVVYICFLAIGAYLVRSYTLDAENTDMVNQAVMYEQTAADDPMALLEQSAPSDDDIALPAEMAQVNETATKKAEDEATSARSSASRVTFVILSVIFVMIQVVGIYFGFAFSYAGKESVKARNYTKNFNSAEELNDWLELKKDLIASQAEAYLQRLREKMSRRAVISSDEQEALQVGSTQRTFHHYLANQAVKKQVQATTPVVMQSSIVVTPVVATEPVIAAAVQAEPVAPAVASAQATEQSLPAELADLDLTKLGEEDLAVLAEDFELDLAWLKKQQRLATIKNKSRTTS